MSIKLFCEKGIRICLRDGGYSLQTIDVHLPFKYAPFGYNINKDQTDSPVSGFGKAPEADEQKPSIARFTVGGRLRKPVLRSAILISAGI
jgi:hypothetical protein